MYDYYLPGAPGRKFEYVFYKIFGSANNSITSDGRCFLLKWLWKLLNDVSKPWIGGTQ